MRFFTGITIALLPLLAVAQLCGRDSPGGTAKCVAGECCSQYSYCGTTTAYCNSMCQKSFGGPSAPSSCRPAPAPSSTRATYPSAIPNIDTCGGTSGNRCSGVGPEGYFYRCCSSAGHCGPKNPIQAASIYCGTGCQAGYGKCDPATPKPTSILMFPPLGAIEAGKGEECGPIVGKKCSGTLCCSGSNFCGDTAPYCGPSNWCQNGWGECWATDGDE